MTYFKKMLTIYLIFMITFVPSFGFGSSVPPADDQECMQLLEKAEESYYDGDLDKAIALIQKCLATPDISESLQLKGNALLARTYLSKDDELGAKSALQKILEINPLYEPTLEEATPRYIALVSKVKREWSQQSLSVKPTDSGMSSWVWIGAGGAAAAVIAVLVLSGSDSGTGDGNTDNSLPQPPALP
jgi:tetratricopeptide (TPR) repeat protein